MSAGPFVNTFYESTELGGVMRIRVQPETLELFAGGEANTPPDGPPDIPLFARVSNTRGKFGVRPRAVTIEWTGDPPAGYSGDNITLPVMRAAAYQAYLPGTEGTYLGQPIQIFSRRCETAL